MHRRRFLCAVGALSACSGCATVESVAGSVRDGLSEEDREVEPRVEQIVLQEVNATRRDHGLELVERDSRLDEVAQEHANEMAEHQYLGHQAPDGSRRGGYCAENVSRVGDPSMDAEDIAGYAMAGWMGSRRHRANILTAGWRITGIGASLGDEWAYITQDFC